MIIHLTTIKPLFAPMLEFKTTESQMQIVRYFIKDAKAYVNSLPDMEVNYEYN
jgi:hypothetical protein